MKELCNFLELCPDSRIGLMISQRSKLISCFSNSFTHKGLTSIEFEAEVGWQMV